MTYGRLAQLVEHLLDVQEVTVRGSQRIGMSTKKDAARPLVWGLFSWWTVQDENWDKQRQGITMRAISCLLIFLTRRGILGLVQQIGICEGALWTNI